MIEIETLFNGKLTHIIIGGAAFYFSYETLVAFCLPGKQRVVSENIWGPTTGKHLNYIDDGDKQSRLSRDEFEKRASLLRVEVCDV